ncbi:hypothetical protein SGLAM104S_01004 [Streptomyces glaucescens]
MALSGLPYASVPPRRSSSTRTPAAPIATSVSPERQGRPKLSATTTPTVTPRMSRSPSRIARAEPSGSSGSSSTVPAGVLEASTPACGHDQALPVLDDAQGASAGDHADGLRVDRGLPVRRLDDPSLRLGHDLGGDQHHVPVGQSWLGRRDQLGEVVPGRHLGDPGHRPDAEGGGASVRGSVPVRDGAALVAHAARTSSASASASGHRAVASTSVIISGTALQRMPASSTRATEPASTVSTSQPSSSPEP